MDKRSKNNYAFIDGQNLYLGILESGWKLDYKRFRVYLEEKYGVEKAYMFMGFLPDNQALYNFLQSSGFVLIFKPIIPCTDHKHIKGNCDAELVLQSMIDLHQYDQAVIVTGDGDFYCLVKYLDEQNKLRKVLSPSPQKCSSLLTQITGRLQGKKISFVSDLRNKIEYKRKRPHEDGTS